MAYKQRQLENALQAARMYYYQNLPMKTIAVEMDVSHSTVSRLLALARTEGLIEIRINDLRGRAGTLEETLRYHFGLNEAHVVTVAELAGPQVWRERVARFAAGYLNQCFDSGMVLGVAWGGTLNRVAAYLTPKSLLDAQVVQLNGGELVSNPDINSAGGLVTQIASNFGASAHLLPVPTYFAYAETKEVLWREPSIQRILELHSRADMFIFSVGSFQGDQASTAYTGSYLRPEDYEELAQQGVVGDVANIMTRADGSWQDIALNARACGPNLQLFQDVERAICVVSGYEKLPVLQGALKGRYISELIIDEPTAHRLLEQAT
jgi:DNA-binding transcriptional regulator LsrR (DeoR family)